MTTTMTTDATSVASADGRNGFERYDELSPLEKLDFLEDGIQIFRGITFAEGISRAPLDVYHFLDGRLPAVTSPETTSDSQTKYFFSEVTRTLSEFSSQAASITLSSPWVDVKAEYEAAKSTSASSGKVTQYLFRKEVVPMVELTIDALALAPTSEFVERVRSAVNGGITPDSYSELIAVLEDFGYYIPTALTLGGAIIGTSEKQISSLSEADSQKSSFDVSFNAKFDGIGGGAAVAHGSGGSGSSSSTIATEEITLNVTGGDPALIGDYRKWVDSLRDPYQWKAVDVAAFRPTLLLLASHDENHATLLTTAIRVIEEFGSTRKSVVDMDAYNTAIQTNLQEG